MRHESFANVHFREFSTRPLDLAVVVPTFNEAANVRPLLDKLAITLAGLHFEVIFVDDNSPDNTADLVRSIARSNPNVRIVHRIGRRGLSSAVIEGMLATAAPILAVMDGDLQHDETILPRLYHAVTSGNAEIAVGTRYTDGGGVGDWDKTRHRISRWATHLAQKVIGTPLSDPMSGFFIIRRETLMAAMPNISGVGFKILLDIVASLPKAPKIAEIPFQFRAREVGESKLGPLVAAEYLSLLAEKTIGKFIPIRFLKFLCVGSLGVLVHLSVLAVTLSLNISFFNAQTTAVAIAIAFNFFLNNIFTYSDRMLKGWALMRGLLSFYLIASIGAVANIGIGTWVNAQDGRWWLAGVTGVIVGAAWNFTASSFFTWRK
ncbi:MAG: glycosyltransferase family 2 protein [Hyphomicrobiaceae bacterium]|nr:glycosyltransferase family 2 protein [Hyphomicrobiaceae bacterium]